MSELTIEARYEKATGHKLPIGYANPDNGYDKDWVSLVLEFAQNELNTRPNDAKWMIAEGLESELAKTHDTIMVAIWEKCEHLHPSVIPTVLDALLEVCKQSSEGE